MVDRSKRRRVDCVNRWLDVVIKVFVIVGGVYTGWLFMSGQLNERKRVVIDEVFRAKSPEVIQALVRLDHANRDRRLDYPEIELDVALVITWYDHLGALWIHDSYLDKCIIKASVAPYATVIADVLTTIKYPVERQTYFNLLRNKMPDHQC